MKNAGLLFICFLSLAISCYADDAPKKASASKDKDAKKADAAVVTAIAQPSAEDIELKFRELLNKKEWQIIFLPVGKPKARPQADTLSFYGNKVSSKRFSAKGFGESNYTLRTLTDGTVTWETAQKNSAEDVLFWKGELQGETMSGVLSLHPKKGGNEDFSFVMALP